MQQTAVLLALLLLLSAFVATIDASSFLGIEDKEDCVTCERDAEAEATEIAALQLAQFGDESLGSVYDGKLWPAGKPRLDANVTQIGLVSARTRHSAFGDLLYIGGRPTACFRESAGHTAYNGIIRVVQADMVHKDGGEGGLKPEIGRWRDLSTVVLPGVDLRDPHLSITPKKEVMLIFGMRIKTPTTPVNTSTGVSFSSDGGVTWTTPVSVSPAGQWRWRAAWSPVDHHAYSLEYRMGAWNPDRNATVVRSPDGITWEPVVRFNTKYRMTEAALSFTQEAGYMAIRAEMCVLPGCDIGGARIARAAYPYKDWTFHRVGFDAGGPAMIPFKLRGDPATRWLVSGRSRRYKGSCYKTSTGVFEVDFHTGEYSLVTWVPAWGDTSYPGMVYDDSTETVYMIYYSQIASNSGWPVGVFAASIQLGRIADTAPAAVV